jgi:hypothetical protein
LKVLVRRGDGHWAEPEITGHQNEDALQQLLATAPDLLPGAETGLPLAVAREFPVSSGRIDIVGVDVDGEITLCECKLATNPGIRREVIGQLLEYASVLQGVALTDFANRFEARHGAALWDAVAGIAGEGFDREAFGQRVAENLGAGRFRLVVVVDRISDALRETILYLNDHLDRAVLALELAYLRDGDVEMLLPRVFGAESAERKRANRAETVADADTVIVAARNAYDNYLATAAYVCQPLRSFRDRVKYLGFYRDKAIQPEIAAIRHRRKLVVFTGEEAARLRGSGDRADAEIAVLIDARLSKGEPPGQEHQVFLLSSKDDPETIRLNAEVRHDGRGAWTQAQRYTTSAALKRNPGTTDDLAANGG